MDKSNVNERFINVVTLIIEQKKVKNKADFAKSLEINPSRFSEILSKRMNVSIDVLQKTCVEYDVSIDYLVFGNGAIFKNNIEKQPNLAPSSPSSMSPQSPPSDIAGLIEVIKTQSKTIEELTRLLGESQDEVKKTVVPKGARAISATAG